MASENILHCSTQGCFTCKALYEFEVVGLLQQRSAEQMQSLLLPACKAIVEKYSDGKPQFVPDSVPRKLRNDKSHLFPMPLHFGPIAYHSTERYWCISISLTLHNLIEGDEKLITTELWEALRSLNPMLLGAGEEIDYLHTYEEIDAALAGRYNRQIIIRSPWID